MKDHNYYVYILASQKNGTIYIGVTGEIIRRISLHKSAKIKGFTKKYGVNILVYYEHYKYVYDALNREKQLKKWNRAWKLKLIEKDNPNWEDLSDKLFDAQNKLEY